MAVTLRVKEGLIERLREVRSIPSEEHFARLIDVDRSTLRRVMEGQKPSGTFMANFCHAFGLGLGEAFEVIEVETLSQARRAA